MSDAHADATPWWADEDRLYAIGCTARVLADYALWIAGELRAQRTEGIGPPADTSVDRLRRHGQDLLDLLAEGSE